MLNLAFDPTPGASVQKLVKVANAVNGTAIVNNCLEPDEFDSAGYYRSPCHNTTTPDPADTISATFESGVSIQYKVTVGNSGAQPLTGVTVVDSTGATGCTFPTTWPVGYSNQPSPGCTYNRTAPNVPNGQTQISYPNVLTVDATEINPEQDSNTVAVQPPPPNWKVDVYVSPFALGDDGDGTGGTADFKNVTDGQPRLEHHPDQRVRLVPDRHHEHRRLDGKRGHDLLDPGGDPVQHEQSEHRGLPRDADHRGGRPRRFNCRYKVDAGTPGVIQNTVTVNSSNAVPPARNNVASATVTNCANPSKVIPNLIGLNKAAAQAAWTAAGFTAGNLSVWNGQNNALTVTQTRQAFQCMARQHDHDDRALTMTLFIRHRMSPRGQALVEFALVLPIFAIMLFGIIDFGRYVFTANSLNNGAREAARFASVVNRPAGVRRADPKRLRDDDREEPRLGRPAERRHRHRQLRALLGGRHQVQPRRGGLPDRRLPRRPHPERLHPRHAADRPAPR